MQYHSYIGKQELDSASKNNQVTIQEQTERRNMGEMSTSTLTSHRVKTSYRSRQMISNGSKIVSLLTIATD